MKICFASDVHYPNYTKRIQEATLKCFLDTELYKYDIHYYISTNRPKDLEHHNNVNNVKVFDIDDLRSENVISQKFELLPENPVGIYPGKYPWNLRRFVIEKAAKDGFDYIIYVDADTILNGNITGEQIVNEIKSKYQENKVKSNAAIFEYEENSTEEHFAQHEKYFEILDRPFQNNELKTLDGPCMVFMGKTNQDILNLVDVWHKFTDFGYQKELGFGYGNNFHGNLSFTIPISGFEVLHEQFPFYPNHIIEDRYTHDYKHNENQEIEKNDIKEKFQFNVKLKNRENDLTEIKTIEPEIKSHDLSFYFKKYATRKHSNGFSQIFENYFKEIKNTYPSILEIGVGTVSLEPPEGRYNVPENMHSWKEQNPIYQPGNSLRAMRDYLVNCELYGIDIQKDCLINEDKINTSIFDSRDPKKSHEFIEDKKFNLIIDDSNKDANMRIITFNNFYDSLKENGYYVIEGLLETQFLCEYFDYYRVSYNIIGDFMIISKNGNFSTFKKIEEKQKNIQSPVSLGVNEYIDYKKLINSTPKFSISTHEFADKGFYINLKKSVERKEKVEKQIEEFKIEGLLRFGALTDEMIQYSCTKSHLQVFRTCLENNIDSVFVAEDDFNIENILYQPNTEQILFQEKIKLVKQDLDNLEWDVFLFGCNPKTHLVPLTNNVAIVNKSTGAWAYVIKKRAFKFLLDNLNYKRDYIAIDDYLPMLNDSGFVTLTSIPLTIGHSVGFVSTLQPNGPVNYTDWIRGNYHKYLFDNYPDNNFVINKIEKNLTIFIPGFFCNDYLTYLRYALKSLPNELRKCKIIIRFDTPTKDYDLTELIKLQAYFRDVRTDLNVSLSYGFGGLISSFNYFLQQVKTPYFMMYGFDYVFLKNNLIKFDKIIDTFDKYSFVNSVYFSGDEISAKWFDFATDKNGKITPFELETRISDTDLITTARWSNKPAIHRVSKMKEWFEKYMINERIGVLHQSRYGIEDIMKPNYNRVISENNWEDIKDDWGTYLYGNFGEGPFIAHTDSSRRYQNENKSMLEINADGYMLQNPLTEND